MGDGQGGGLVEPELVAEAEQAADAELDLLAVAAGHAGGAEAGADEQALDDEEVALDVAAEQRVGAEAGAAEEAAVEVGAEGDALA
jgi:hypothetical protein